MAFASGRGPRYRAFRIRMLNRARWRCSRCGGAARLELHHRVPVAAGGALLDEANVRVLCRSCHIGHHRDHPARPPPDRPAGYQAWRELANAPIRRTR